MKWHRARRLAVLAGIVLGGLLAACGGSEQEGVTLQVAGGRAATATPTPPAAVAATGQALSWPLSGRLLLLKGNHFELYDLGSGETTSLDSPDLRAFSPVGLNADRTRGVFVAFPDFGLLDLTAGTLTRIDNDSSNPTGVGISPDGRWLAATTGGQFIGRLQVIALDGSGTVINVASSGGAFYDWRWTADSRLLWGNAADPAAPFQVLDPSSGQSRPVDSTPLNLSAGYGKALSPDGTRLASIPVMVGPDSGFSGEEAAGTPEGQTCFDSTVQLTALPVRVDGPLPDPQVVWTESGLIASSPHWLDNERLLFVKLGSGACGQIEGEPPRQIMLLDTAGTGAPVAVAGPLGNPDDPNDRVQGFGRLVDHLYSPSPDGRYIAWIGGGREARESLLNVTEIASGQTQTLLAFPASDASDLADYIEHVMLRQVIWLE